MATRLIPARDRWAEILCLGLALILLMAGCSRAPRRVPLPIGQQPQIFSGELGSSLNREYLLYLPEEINRKKQKRWPVILYLHGGSLRGEKVERVKSYGLPRWLEKQRNFPFLVISPQCPPGQRWNDPEGLVRLLEEVCRRFPVDHSRVYLTGISMGGGGAWLLASRHPEWFAAVAPLCGPGQTSWACGLKSLPVRVYHGAKDTTIPLRRSEEMVSALKACGGQVELMVLPEAAHDLTWLYERKELFEWFLSHRK